MFVLRLTCDGESSNLVLRSCPSMTALLTMLNNLFGLPATKIEYKDEEGDMVSVGSQLELDEGLY